MAPRSFIVALVRLVHHYAQARRRTRAPVQNPFWPQAAAGHKQAAAAVALAAAAAAAGSRQQAAGSRQQAAGSRQAEAEDWGSQRNRGAGVELETALPERTRHTARSPGRRRTGPRHPLGGVWNFGGGMSRLRATLVRPSSAVHDALR
jgi:hypothetical protein